MRPPAAEGAGTGRIRGFLARVGCLALLLIGAAGGWVFQDSLQRVWADRVRPAASATLSALGGDAPAAVDRRRDAPETPVDSAPRADGAARDDSAVPPGEEVAPGAAAPAPEPGAGASGAAPEPDEPEGPEERSGEAATGKLSWETDRGGSATRGSTAAGVDPVRWLPRFFGPGGGGELRLDSTDLARLLEAHRPHRLPAGVRDPRVVPKDSALAVSADVDLGRVLGDRLPALVRRMVGDSARVTALLEPEVPAPGFLRLRVREVRAGSVGLPSALIPWLLDELGMPVASTDPRSVELRPGRGLTGARVREGVLVLARDPER